MKKFAITIGAMVMVILMASPVLAKDHGRGNDGISIENEEIIMVNASVALSNSGLNSQDLFGRGGQTMRTGDAIAMSGSFSTVSTTVKSNCCDLDGVKVENERLGLLNISLALSNSGLNRQMNTPMPSRRPATSCQDMRTGDSISEAVSDAGVWTLVEVGRSRGR